MTQPGKRIILIKALNLIAPVMLCMPAFSFAQKESESFEALVQKALVSGDAAADVSVAAYLWKNGPEKCPLEACKWYERAASKGNPEGQYGLARCYNGFLSCWPNNSKEALTLLKKAADQGHEEARKDIAYLHVPEKMKVLDAARKAAEGGSITAQSWLGEVYFGGRGVPSDGKEAEKWFMMAVSQNDVRAAFELGECYRYGPCRPREQAVTWLRKAADSGHALAMKRLADMYENGRGGVTQDLMQAIEWLQRSIEHDKDLLTHNADQIAGIYARLNNIEQEYIWNNIAAAAGTGSPIAEVRFAQRDKAASKLSPKQLIKAQKTATKLYETLSSGSRQSFDAPPFEPTVEDFSN